MTATKQCTKCKRKRNGSNPFGKCFECKERFCFDCLWGGQVNDSMSASEEIRDVCDSCKAKYMYRSL